MAIIIILRLKQRENDGNNFTISKSITSKTQQHVRRIVVYRLLPSSTCFSESRQSSLARRRWHVNYQELYIAAYNTTRRAVPLHPSHGGLVVQVDKPDQLRITASVDKSDLLLPPLEADPGFAGGWWGTFPLRSGRQHLSNDNYCLQQRWNRVRIFDPWRPTRPDPVVERCETNPRQRLDSSISYLSGNPNRLVA